MNRSLTLFAVNSLEDGFTRVQLLAATQQGSTWRVASTAGLVSFLSFPEIHDEKYRLYHDVSA